MGKTINCAVIGAGRLGLVHANNLVRHVMGVNVKVIVTTREETAKKAAIELGIPNWSTNYEEVLKDHSIDAVIIGTPTKTHGKLIIEAAKHKKHIFVDKPITETVDEAEKVIEIVKKQGVICQVGFMRRFDPAYEKAKRRILAGDIGKPIHFKGVSRDPGSPPESYIATSGTIFLDLCIHEYDIARYMMESEVKSITTFGTIQIHPFMKKYRDVDQSLSYLEFESGATGEIEGSRNSSYGYDIRGEIIGTEGMIQIGSIQHHNNIVLTKNNAYFDTIPDFPTNFKEAFLNEIEHFIECVRENNPPLVNEYDGKVALQISEAAIRSFKENKTINL